jgi:hypothetical protein
MPITYHNLEDGSFVPQYCENADCGRHLTMAIVVHWHARDPYSGNMESPSKRYSCNNTLCKQIVAAMPYREPPRVPRPAGAKVSGFYEVPMGEPERPRRKTEDEAKKSWEQRLEEQGNQQ